jgi:hypothetical protein
MYGCADSPEPTCLSLQFGKMQGDFAKLQGWRRLFPAETHRISMAWMALSLIQEQGDESSHSREGRPSENAGGVWCFAVSRHLFERATVLHQTPQLHSLAFFVAGGIGAASPQAA